MAISFGQAEALQVITLVYSASITMSTNTEIRIQVLTAVAATLAFLSESKIGIDFVKSSPGPVSERGEANKSFV